MCIMSALSEFSCATINTLLPEPTAGRTVESQKVATRLGLGFRVQAREPTAVRTVESQKVATRLRHVPQKTCHRVEESIGMEEKGEIAYTYASQSVGTLLSVWHGRRGGPSWLECASAVFDTQDWRAKWCKSFDCLDNRERGRGLARLTIEHRASTRRMARGFGLKSHIWGRGPGCRVKKDREGLEGCLLWNASPSFCLGRRAPWPTPLYGRSSSQRNVR